MLRKIPMLISMLLLAFLLGCNAKAQTLPDSNQLHEDAREIYESIVNTGLDGEYLSEYESEKIKEFTTNYLDHSEKYPKDENLLIKIDQLIQNHKMYFVAVGLEDKEAIHRHKDNFNKAITYLEKNLK
jgi:hypothetical protein